jgi:isopenicillin N synthase-like dioxygenase
MANQHVPVIDISPFLEGDKDDVVTQVRDACEGVGFFTIVGHGVAPEIIADLRASARAFFARPAAEKNAVHHADPSLPRGYRAIGDEGLAYGSGEETPPDLKEVFHMGPPDFPVDTYHTADAAAGHFIENVYPERPEEFRAASTAYYKRLETRSRNLPDVRGCNSARKTTAPSRASISRRSATSRCSTNCKNRCIAKRPSRSCTRLIPITPRSFRHRRN